MTSEISRSSTPASGDYIDLYDSALVLKKYRKSLLWTPLVLGVTAALISLALPNQYTATARILPPQSASGASALLGQLGGLGGLAGAALGSKPSGETYVGMLGSRTVADRLIARYKLEEVYETEKQSEAVLALNKASSIVNGRDGIIVVSVDDRDPQRAAALANAYVEELKKLTETLAVSEASQRRLFLEQRLKQAKEALGDSEVSLKQMQEKTGVIKLDGQAQGAIAAIATLKAQIAAKEVALGAMGSFATAENPLYQRAQRELAGLRAQLTKLETAANAGSGDVSIATARMPELGMEYVRRVRDVKYNEALFETLAKQYELARIDEARDSSMVQVLDTAVVPDRKSKPRRSIIVLAALVLGVAAAVAAAFVREALARGRSRRGA